MSDWSGNTPPPADDDDFNLDWLGQDDDDTQNTPADDDSFSFEWMGDDGEPTGDNTRQKSGFTDELPWMAENTVEGEGGLVDDADWAFFGGDDAEEEPPRDREMGIGQSQPRRAVQKRAEDNIEAAENAEWGNTGDLLDWMSDPDDGEIDLSLFGSADLVTDPIAGDVPSWLLEAKPSDFGATESPDATPEELFANIFGTDTQETDAVEDDKPRTDELNYFSLEPQFLDEPTAIPDWLGRLGTDEMVAVSIDDDNPFGASEDEFDFDSLMAQSAPTTPAPDDIDLDALLASFDEPIAQQNDLAEFFDPEIFDMSAIAELDDDVPDAIPSDDFSSLFNDDADEGFTSPAYEREEEANIASSELPEWLRESKKQAGGISAILREREDRSLEQLDDRTLELRELGMNISIEEETTPQSSQLKSILADVPEFLSVASFSTQSTSPVLGTMKLTSEQEKRAHMLNLLVKGESVAQSRERRRLRFPLGRVLVALLLLGAILVPLLTNFSFIPNPPASFSAGSMAQGAFSAIDALPEESFVLLAIEYGGSASQELDDTTTALLQHIASRGAKPILTSGNSLSLVRASALAEAAFPQGANSNYYVTRYLPDTVMSLRDLVENTPLILKNDAQGKPNGIRLNSLDALTLIIVVSDNSDTLRAWMEQVKPNTTTPFIVASSYGATPLIMPYLEGAGVAGHLVGYESSLIYKAQWEALYVATAQSESVITEETGEGVASPTNTPRATNTVRPTTQPQPLGVPSSTTTPIPSGGDTVATIAPATATNTPIVPTNTAVVATNTAIATSTSTTRPTNTPSNTPSNTPTPADDPLVLVGLITATGSINVRESASSVAGTPIIGTLASGTQVRVIGFNDAQDWVQVVLPDNRLGWVAANLISVEERRQSEFTNPKVRPARFQQSTPEPRVLIGTVIIEGELEVLERPEPSAPVIGAISAGQPVRVLLIDGDWTSVILPDNRVGWVETFLLEVEEITQSRFEALSLSSQAVDSATNTPVPNTSAPTNTPIVATSTTRSTVTSQPLGVPSITTTAISTNTATHTPTPVPATATFTATPQPEATEEATVSLAVIEPAPPTAQGGARWQSQNLGIMMALLLIVAGNIFYLLRHLFRRGRSS